MLLFAALAVLPQRDDASLSSSALSLKTGQGRSGVCPPIENRHRAKFEKKVLSPGQCTGHSLPQSELLARSADSLSVGTSFDHGRRELKPCHVLSFRKGQRALGVQFSLSLVSRSSTAHDRLSLCLLSLRRWADTPGGRIGEGGGTRGQHREGRLDFYTRGQRGSPKKSAPEIYSLPIKEMEKVS